jgi:hypothetical protein
VRTSVSAAPANSDDPFCFIAQSERAASARIAESPDLRGAAFSRHTDAALSALHEIGNCLTPLMVNTEMIMEQSARGDVREIAQQIFNAARRIAFTLRRLRPIEEHQSVAYLGQNRLLDLRIVAPPGGPILERAIGYADEVPHRGTGSAATFFDRSLEMAGKDKDKTTPKGKAATPADTESGLQAELGREAGEGADSIGDVGSNRTLSGSSTWETLPEEGAEKAPSQSRAKPKK